MQKQHPGKNTNDKASVWLLCQEAQRYADIRVAQAIQSVIDYEHERGHEAISLDEERGAKEYADIFCA